MCVRVALADHAKYNLSCLFKLLTTFGRSWPQLRSAVSERPAGETNTNTCLCTLPALGLGGENGRCCASLRGVLRSVKLMRVIFPTRGGINRLSRLTRLPASAPQDHLIGGSSLFSALCPGFDKSASWRSTAQKGKKHADFSTRFLDYIVPHHLYSFQVQQCTFMYSFVRICKSGISHHHAACTPSSCSHLFYRTAHPLPVAMTSAVHI